MELRNLVLDLRDLGGPVMKECEALEQLGECPVCFIFLSRPPRMNRE